MPVIPCSVFLRDLVVNARFAANVNTAFTAKTWSIEAADLVVRYLYDRCVDSTTSERSCALVRFYKTHPFGALEHRLHGLDRRDLAFDIEPGERCRAELCQIVGHVGHPLS